MVENIPSTGTTAKTVLIGILVVVLVISTYIVGVRRSAPPALSGEPVFGGRGRVVNDVLIWQDLDGVEHAVSLTRVDELDLFTRHGAVQPYLCLVGNKLNRVLFTETPSDWDVKYCLAAHGLLAEIICDIDADGGDCDYAGPVNASNFPNMPCDIVAEMRATNSTEVFEPWCDLGRALKQNDLSGKVYAT